MSSRRLRKKRGGMLGDYTRKLFQNSEGRWFGDTVDFFKHSTSRTPRGRPRTQRLFDYWLSKHIPKNKVKSPHGLVSIMTPRGLVSIMTPRDSTVKKLKKQLFLQQNNEGDPNYANLISLKLNGKTLDDSTNIYHAGIRDNSTITAKFKLSAINEY